MGPIARNIARLRPDRRVTLRWVTTDIALLDAGRRAPWRRLRRDGVDAALDLRTAAEGGGLDEFPSSEFVLRWCPVSDGGAPAFHDLIEVTDWLSAQVARGMRVAVACREGRGRSALLVCATLMRLGYSLEGAYRLVRRAQPSIALSDRQIRVLEELNRS
ncbi:MAG: dual specificity protein phosphatase family protein [Dehalococcoidia bacterium]|nr:dual specificity protein phosphatase family protein [Dehalococcoidia bacterium]